MGELPDFESNERTDKINQATIDVLDFILDVMPARGLDDAAIDRIVSNLPDALGQYREENE